MQLNMVEQLSHRISNCDRSSLSDLSRLNNRQKYFCFGFSTRACIKQPMGEINLQLTSLKLMKRFHNATARV